MYMLLLNYLYSTNRYFFLPRLSTVKPSSSLSLASTTYSKSEVYFGSGEKLGTINSELIRKTVTYDNIGDNVKNAIIASEDSNFYSNSGIDIWAVLRATHSEATGARTTGGSTITQQLVKNQLLDNSRFYERKAKEILLALRVDNHFSKNEILENYLNVSPFGKNSLGQNISGIETAAQGVFGVHLLYLLMFPFVTPLLYS